LSLRVSSSPLRATTIPPPGIVVGADQSRHFERGVGYPKATVLGGVGLHAPAGMSPAILKALDAAVSKALQNPELRKRLAAQGADMEPKTIVAYGKLVADETVRWKQVAQTAGISPTKHTDSQTYFAPRSI
jgi:Tripartite tricarboxylate transporter family receptor